MCDHFDTPSPSIYRCCSKVQLGNRFIKNDDLKVSIKTQAEDRLTYPRITICDNNVLSWYKINKNSRVFEKIKKQFDGKDVTKPALDSFDISKFKVSGQNTAIEPCNKWMLTNRLLGNR